MTHATVLNKAYCWSYTSPQNWYLICSINNFYKKDVSIKKKKKIGYLVHIYCYISLYIMLLWYWKFYRFFPWHSLYNWAELKDFYIIIPWLRNFMFYFQWKRYLMTWNYNSAKNTNADFQEISVLCP